MKLTRSEWHSRRDAHRQRVGPWIEALRDRAARGAKHPVYDFLFTYYSFRSGHLLRWSPGVDVEIEGIKPQEADWPAEFEESKSGSILRADRFPEHRLSYLNWAINYLEAVLEREPAFHCFGLHEWAMVYRSPEVRHSQVPLRLLPEEIADLVEGQGLRCTHYDAFRFFTPAAAPLNRVQLNRKMVTDFDQAGCIHANMDLYKFAYTIAPFTSAELVADAFDLARTTRELDMRASPYDLRTLGFEPIRIETKEGRETYVAGQKQISAAAQSLRWRVLCEYRRLAELRGCNAAVTAAAAS